MAMEPLLRDVFNAIENAAIPYCLLRGYGEIGEKTAKKEIDLLVDCGNLKLFAATVDQFGFVSLPSWGYAPHHFFVAYDEVNDTWLKLDVVTEIAYGKPVRHLYVDVEKQCLSSRLKNNGVYVLKPELEYITLLLHCILDKETFQKKHRARLVGLQNKFDQNDETKAIFVETFKRYLPSEIDWHDIAQALEREDWQWFSLFRRQMTRQLLWKRPFKNTYHKFKTIILRRIRPLLFILQCHGISVAVLAPDGAGKSTLADELTRTDYIRARLIYMGTNSEASNIGLPTTRWLKERVKSLNRSGRSPKGVILRGLNYGNRLVEQWYRYIFGLYHKMLGRFVIFDRYAYDHYLAPSAKTLGRQLRRWLLKHTCPSPDVVLFLDAPGEILFQRKGEHSPERLEAQRRVFLALKDKIPNMVVMDATRDANEVRRDAIAKIWNFYGSRLLKKAINGNDF